MNRVFRLDSIDSTLLIAGIETDIPAIRYWGPRLDTDVDPDVIIKALKRPVARACLDFDLLPSLLPEAGLGWFGSPGLLGSRGTRDWATMFRLETVDQSDGLQFHCHDPVACLDLVITLRLDSESNVVVRRTSVTNRGDSEYSLQWCAAGAFPVPPRCEELLSFEGHWSREFHEQRERLAYGIWSRENRRGRTSHDSFPGLIIGTNGFCDNHGHVYGFHLGWSGNHRFFVECLNDGSRQIQMGELLMPGEISLGPNQSYESPELYATFSGAGLNCLSNGFHHFVRHQLLDWPGGSMQPRPIHLNTWEAIYFDHDRQKLEALARAASEIGVERFVLDDGWFCGRNDDSAGLGDWTPDPDKYPNGLAPIIDFVRDQGMTFGLWVEPEMINERSELYRAKPDWVLQLDGRPLLTGRHQLVLDLSRVEVADYIFDALDRLLSSYRITYLKWDMNRDLAPAASAGRAVYGQQTRALYRLIDRLRAAHPDVEIESCASGGGRADYGVLSRTHRIWTSDCNDALERQTIQKGFLRFFPIEVQGAHIGPSPTHTTGRMQSLGYRAATALFGHFGLEIDLLAVSDTEREELHHWIGLYKQFRGLMHTGRYLRSDSPMPGTEVYGVVAGDRHEALFAVCQTGASPVTVPLPLTFPGLDPKAPYAVSMVSPDPAFADGDLAPWRRLHDGNIVLTGELLDHVGIQPPILPPETALVLRFSAATID